MDLSVIYEDNHLLVVDKAAGLLTQGDRSGAPTLVDAVTGYLKEKYHKPGKVYVGLVHRLDRNVGGVVVLARTSKAAGRLSAQFRDGQVQKTYEAVVTGGPSSAEGELVSWLAPAGDRRGVTRASEREFAGARKSRLRYYVEAQQNPFSLLRIEPLTGRRHQIRAQMSLLGCPLLGDVKYGSGCRLPNHGLALRAARLVFAHPVGGREMVISAPRPRDWPWPDPARKLS